MSLTEITKEEIETLVEFSKTLIVKRQEEADAAEGAALRATTTAAIVTAGKTRDWKQAQVYVSLDQEPVILTRRGSGWVEVTLSGTTSAAVDESGSLWVREPGEALGFWTNRSNPRLEPILDGMIGASWPRLQVPAGKSWVDPLTPVAYLQRDGWYDSVTREASLVSPWLQDPFVEGAKQDTTYPVGLSSLIQSSQEYVAAKLIYDSGPEALTAQERAAYRTAIDSFEAYGLWEDVRQSPYVLAENGAVQLGVSGKPIDNPQRQTLVRYRGEYNTYYRSLVRDFNVDLVAARTAEQFEAIGYRSPGKLSPREVREFMKAHSESVRVFKQVMYNQSYEGDSLYLDYCRLFINWMTLMRVVNGRMEGYGDIDRMPNFDVNNFLYSFGMYQFDAMPLGYKRRFAKNIERIISNKGSTAVFRDILALFGMGPTIDIWKYYLVKYYPVQKVRATFPRAPLPSETVHLEFPDGAAWEAPTVPALVAEITEDGQEHLAAASLVSPTSLTYTPTLAMTLVDEQDPSLWYEDAFGSVTLTAVQEDIGEDWTQPEVGFLRTDIDSDQVEPYIRRRDLNYLLDYDEFVQDDPTWELSREQARIQDFSVLQTKYMTMTAALDVARNGMSLSFLWGTLRDAEMRGRGGLASVPVTVDATVGTMTLFQAMTALLTLTLWKFGVEDIIPHGESGVAAVLAARTDGAPFPGEDTLLPYPTVLARVADTPDPLTADALVGVVNTNMALRQKVSDSVAKTGKDALNHREYVTDYNDYVLRRQLWTHKFVSTYQTQAFGSTSHYSEWMEGVNKPLADWMRYQDEQGTYNDAIIALVSAVENAVDNPSFSLSLSSGTLSTVLGYIEKMVRYFKSYTVDLKKVSMFMVVGDASQDSVRLVNYVSRMGSKFPRREDLSLLERRTAVSRLRREETELRTRLRDLYVWLNLRTAAREDVRLADTVAALRSMGVTADDREAIRQGQDSWLWEQPTKPTRSKRDARDDARLRDTIAIRRL